MHSEFYHVELDRIRYSLVWEDFKTLSDGLRYTGNDHLLIITSAGCNVLNSVLQPIARVTAIDLNPVQNALLNFKIFIIEHHDYNTYAALLGLRGQEAVSGAWAKVSESLATSDRIIWEQFFKQHPEGLLLAGKLERYVTAFLSCLDTDVQNKLKTLLTFSKVADQYSFFRHTLDLSDFRNTFITYFNEANLSKGRDAKLFKYAEEQSGETFYVRLANYMKKFLTKDNFYFRFFFFGILNLEQELLPACYQEKNFANLRSNLHKINVVDGEAIEFLLSDKGSQITKASLSNIFEYTTHEEFSRVCHDLHLASSELTFVYWNLLQEQTFTNTVTFKLTSIHPNPKSCFYFKNAKLINLSNY